jgi:hypothetical protein
LFRSKRLFPRNADLVAFAARVLEGFDTYRFDKLSRADIAARMVEYIESRDAATQRRLKEAMKAAMDAPSEERRHRRESFFSNWEKIIRGM